MTSTMNKSLRWSIGLLVMWMCAFTTSAWAQNPQDAADPWQRAKQAYSQQDWDTATRYTAAASQRDPEEPRYYLALARIAFQQQRYDDAVWFYDTFLTLARGFAGDLSGNYAPARAEAERKSANDRRQDPDAASQEPEAQQQVRQSLLQRIQEGPIVAENGGAIAVFESLMRMGYANPDLLDLRARLDAAAQKEGDALFENARDRLPHQSVSAWKLQALRYDATGQFIPAATRFDDQSPTPHVATDPRARAYRLIAEGQMEYLLENWQRAANAFADALSLDAHLVYAHKGYLNALLSHDNPNIDTIQAALLAYKDAFPDDRDYPIYRAMVFASTGHADLAAQELIGLLVRDAADENAP